jgi:hypothetical protein
MKKRLPGLIALLSLSVAHAQEAGYKLDPPRYVAYKSPSPICIDGEIGGDEWANAPWSDAFVDIRGAEFEKQPCYTTRMKIMWDEENLYLAGELPEPHIWATKTKRDSTIYWDNDFEVFLDPDGDTHHYFEFEINAFGTEWDLLMTRGYRFGGTYLNGFQMIGMETKVKLYGTVNNPTDTDEKWVVEMKIPFRALVNRRVTAGTQWRMNFSRVEWLKVNTDDGTYQKNEGAKGFGHEENWVWAPTRAVDIHRPEYWGFVQFSDKPTGNPLDDFEWNRDEDIKFALRRLLNMQLDHFKKHGAFAKQLEDETLKASPRFYPAGSNMIISLDGENGDVWYISSDSRVWKESAR